MLVGHIDKFYHLFRDREYRFEGHRHNSHEVNAVLNGSLEVTYGDAVFTLSSGDLFIGEPGIFHRNRMLGAGVNEFISIHFVSAEGEHIRTPAVYRMSQSDIRLLELIEEEVDSSKYDGGNISQAALYLLEALLLRVAKKDNSPTLSESKDSELYRRAVHVMESRLGETFSVKQISQMCGVCMTTLKSAFSEYAGKGVGEYYLDMRMEKARRMLADGAKVESVSSALGFSSPSYFSQCFKRENGCSASEYRTRYAKTNG